MFSKVSPFTKSGSLVDFLRVVRARITDHFTNTHLTYAQALKRFFSNHRLSYRLVSFDWLKQSVKRSDTVFIVGSGPSLNDLMPEQLAEIAKHDVFGLSLSFLKREIRSTYQIFSWEASQPEATALAKKIFAMHREKLRQTVFLHHDKDIMRFLHPRLIPEYFPESPTVCYYYLPPAIHLNAQQDFTDADFDLTLYYRGTITLVMHLCVLLGYKRIVLLGVDPQTVHHFFDQMPEMKEYCDLYYSWCDKVGLKQFESMTPKESKSQTIDHYYKRVAEYLKRKRGVELNVGTAKSLLSPEVPAYFK